MSEVFARQNCEVDDVLFANDFPSNIIWNFIFFFSILDARSPCNPLHFGFHIRIGFWDYLANVFNSPSHLKSDFVVEASIHSFHYYLFSVYVSLSMLMKASYSGSMLRETIWLIAFTICALLTIKPLISHWVPSISMQNLSACVETAPILCPTYSVLICTQRWIPKQKSTRGVSKSE